MKLYSENIFILFLVCTKFYYNVLIHFFFNFNFKLFCFAQYWYEKSSLFKITFVFQVMNYIALIPYFINVNPLFELTLITIQHAFSIDMYIREVACL